MEKQELLEKIAPYLPYEVKVSDVHTLNIGEGIGSLSHILTTKSEKYKLRLRPLSDLTKEISHKGIQIKPLEVIGQDYIGDGFLDDDGLGFGWGQSTGGGDEQDYWLTIENEKHLKMVIWCGNKQDNGYVVEEYFMPYMYFNMLLKWHFDVSGLIEDGYAIDINTL